MSQAGAPRADGPAAPAPLPPTSLIIPSRNRPDILADTVASILAGDEVPTELIIVDQSDAPHADLPDLRTDRPCEVRYRWARATGVSRARNEGIEAARHPILAFTDDDVLAAPTWFGMLIRALIERGPECVVTGQVRPAEGGEGGVVLSTVVGDAPAVYEGRVGVDILFPPNMAMYRSVLDRVGLFDLRLGWGSRFPTAEDNDLGFRILEAGYRIHYVPEPVVYHRAWRPIGEYLPLKWKYSRGQGAYYAKHFRLRDRYMLWRLLSELRLRTGRLVRSLPSNPRRAAGQLVSIVGVSTGFAEWLITRPGPE
jgi:GT2 family glycosyltransferase